MIIRIRLPWSLSEISWSKGIVIQKFVKFVIVVSIIISDLHLVVKQCQCILEGLHHLCVFGTMSSQISDTEREWLTMLFFVFHIDFRVLDMLHLSLEPAEYSAFAVHHTDTRVSPFQSPALILLNGSLRPGHENL